MLVKTYGNMKINSKTQSRIQDVLNKTITDLAISTDITSELIAEAIQYPSLDREGWAE